LVELDRATAVAHSLSRFITIFAIEAEGQHAQHVRIVPQPQAGSNRFEVQGVTAEPPYQAHYYHLYFNKPAPSEIMISGSNITLTVPVRGLAEGEVDKLPRPS
jgi:hypothetical protein